MIVYLKTSCAVVNCAVLLCCVMRTRFFKITERGSTIGTEIKSGIATFLTMSYILLVNPQILGAAGGQQLLSSVLCVCTVSLPARWQGTGHAGCAAQLLCFNWLAGICMQLPAAAVKTASPAASRG